MPTDDDLMLLEGYVLDKSKEEINSVQNVVMSKNSTLFKLNSGPLSTV